MKLNPSRERTARYILLALAVAMAIVLCSLAPRPALAEDESDNVAYVKDSAGNITYYTDWVKAKNDAYGSGKTMVMLKDWTIGATIVVADSQELTIDMNGHRVTAKYTQSGFNLREHSTLTLMSSRPNTTFSYKGYTYDGSTQLELVSGGLLTGSQVVDGGGIKMDSDSHLVLDGVAIAGNLCSSQELADPASGGGVYAKSDCVIDMKNGATIQHNRSNSNGGGVYLSGENNTLNIDNASICYNVAAFGGGVFANGKKAYINLTNNGSIDGNESDAGGGILIHDSFFYVKSPDKTGSISNNKAWNGIKTLGQNRQNGGGIHARTCSGENEGLIQGVKIENNWTENGGGAVFLNQEWTRIVDCTITSNTASEDGGGVYVNNDNCSIEGCAITGNSCDGKSDNYEGGGVFVGYKYDVKLSGTCTIMDNTRGKDSDNLDDLFLSTISGQTGYAYITGSLSQGSTVGVRTGIEGDRRVARNFNPDSKDCLFADMDGYYISYGTDKGGDAWQRHAAKSFSVTLNGKSVGSYQYGSLVMVAADDVDPGKFFWHWDRESTKGLNPIKTFIPDSLLYNQGLSFNMPQNDVALVAVYGDEVASGQLELASPVAGQELPTTATFKRTDGGTGGEGDVTVNVAWYKVSESGQEELATGKAEYGATYLARTWVSADQEAGRVFSDLISVQIESGAGEGSAADKAEVRIDGSLYVQTAAYQTEKPTVTEVYPASAMVQEGVSEAELRSQFPSRAAAMTNAGTIIMLDVDTEGGDLGDLVKDGEVVRPPAGSKTVGIPVSSSEVTIPSSLATIPVTVVVTEKPAVQPDAPTVSPDEGTYSTSEQPEAFEDGKLKLTASCSTADAEIKYRLSWNDGGEWSEGDTQECTDNTIYLKKNDGGQRLYRLELWSEKDGLESEHTHLSYTVDDIQMETVTVQYADTAIDGQHGTKADDTHEAAQGLPLFIVAPERKGYVFEKWLDSDGAVLDTGSVLAIDAVEESMAVTAVYNPVVSELAAGFAAPIAHNELATSGTVQAKAGDSDKYFDIEGYFIGEDGKASISWSPEGDADGKAEHERSYTAAMTLKNDAAKSGVKYVISPDVKILLNEMEIEGGSAYIAQAADGTKSLCIAFESTGPLENPVFDHDLGTVELTHEQALVYQSGQDAGKDETWSLPKEVEATCKCGCTIPLDISWEAVEGFDKGNSDAQELKVKGKVSFPSYVDPQDDEGGLVSDKVTATVKVAAAEQDGGSDQDDGQDGGRDASDQGQATDGSDGSDGTADGEADVTAGSADDSTVPATGDTALAPAMALATIAAFVAAAAMAALRRRRNER